MKFSAIFLLAAMVVGSASAVVVPNSLAATEGDGVFSLTSTGATGRTYQFIIGSNQLSSVVGHEVFGMRFRMNGAVTAAWPAAGVTYADWDVFMGAGVAPSAASNTFASNFSSSTTQVRDGAHSWNPGDFTIGGSPNNFGAALMFNSQYLYSGGDLTIEMRFSQQVGSTTQAAFDAVTASLGPGNGWGVDFASRWTGNAAGTTGGNANFVVADLITRPVPEPATMIALGAGFAALAARKRRK